MLIFYLSIILVITILMITYSSSTNNNIISKYNLLNSFKNKKYVDANDYFSKIYAICIPNRKEHIKNLMKEVDLNIEIVDAILKNNIDLDDLVMTNKITDECKKNKSKGKIACHLSHLKAIEKFLEDENAKTCLIFEDDLKIPFDAVETKERISDVINDLPEYWDIIYFGRCWDKMCKKQEQIGKYLYSNVKPLCRHAYALSRSGAEKILSSTLPMDKLNGDQEYLRLIIENRLSALAVHPQLFNQNREHFGSNLENNDSLQECTPTPKVNNVKKESKFFEYNFSPKKYYLNKNPVLTKCKLNMK